MSLQPLPLATSPYSFTPLESDPGEDLEDFLQEQQLWESQQSAVQTQRICASKNVQLTAGEAEKMALQYYAHNLEMLSQQRRCPRCGVYYTELENFQWKCRTHLPGPLYDEQDHFGGVRSCCGSSADPMDAAHYNHNLLQGCTRCDHGSNLQDVALPCILVDRGIIEVTEGAIVRCVHDEQNILHSYYEVRRYDMSNSSRPTEAHIK